MNTKMMVTAGAFALLLAGAVPVEAPAQMRGPRIEYVDIRWDGVDRLCVVYPDGRVDFIGEELKNIPRPDRVDRRAFYMTIAVGRMVAQGYELAAAFSDEIIMKRAMP
ncbi:MAG: hypothetical protein JO021_12050 [Alphaproteobacteria bacterium]|nr:hypothetical protein [Alphaproteobacteria bacterium]